MTALFLRISEAKLFKNFVIALILFSAVLIGLETSASFMQQFGFAAHTLDKVILILFTIELIIRIFSYGRFFWKFFLNTWNIFDFLIVFVCYLPFDSHYAVILRLFRILRVLRLVTAIPRLRILVEALFKSLPSMGYVVLLLLLHFYIFGVIGVFLFSKFSPQYFHSLPQTMLTLFQIMTLEGWVEILQVSTRAGHWAWITPLYFVCFILCGTMIILNLLVGVIVNGMQESQKQIENDVKYDSKESKLDLLQRRVQELNRLVEDLRKN